MSAYMHRGTVYFATCGSYVKIGYSCNVKARLHALRTKKSDAPADLRPKAPLQLLHTIPGCIMRDERRIHGLFEAHRAVGEWYRLDEAFLRHLAGLDYVTDAEVLRRFRAARRILKSAALEAAA